MKVVIHENGSNKIAEVTAGTFVFTTPQEALELLLGLSYEHQVSKIILHQKNIPADFFDLKTRLAGEVLQKVVNYRIQLAIVGDFVSIPSESLRAFIIECNRGNQIFFVDTLETAKSLLFEKPAVS